MSELLCVIMIVWLVAVSAWLVWAVRKMMDICSPWDRRARDKNGRFARSKGGRKKRAGKTAK